jgi:YD repeat-containing protein
MAIVHEYGYDGQGNLTAVKNPLGQTLMLSNYTVDGQVGRVTDANGVATDFAYDARGRLISATSGARTSIYSYDLVGNLVSVASAGEAALELRYDGAHRLVQVVAGDGASVNYTLDVYGNKTGETIVDDKGTLTRQIARVFDALNRLQQITGDIQ